MGLIFMMVVRFFGIPRTPFSNKLIRIFRNNQKMGLHEGLLVGLVVQVLILWNIVRSLGKSEMHARVTRLFILDKQRQLI